MVLPRSSYDACVVPVPTPRTSTLAQPITAKVAITLQPSTDSFNITAPPRRTPQDAAARHRFCGAVQRGNDAIWIGKARLIGALVTLPPCLRQRPRLSLPAIPGARA